MLLTVLPQFCLPIVRKPHRFSELWDKNQRPNNVAEAKIGSGGHQVDSQSASTLANRGLSVEVARERKAGICLTHDGIKGHHQASLRQL